MNIRLKQTALAAVFLCAALSSMQTVSADDQRSAVTLDKRPVGAFNAIELAGPFRVIVTEGTPRLELSGDPKQLAEIETEVRGGTLVVRQRSRSSFGIHWGKRDGPDVIIRIGASGLKSLVNSGSGEVELDAVGGERFVLSSQGPGDVRARGAVKVFEVNSSGSGDIDLRQVKANNVALAMSGPGDVRLGQVGNELSGRMSGSGDLDDGRAERISAELSGSGTLQARRLTVRQTDINVRGPGSAAVNQVREEAGERHEELVQVERGGRRQAE